MPTREEMIAQIQAEMAKRQNPNTVSDRAGALKKAMEVDAPLEAGPWYMDLAKDVLNPVDAAAGLATGGMKAAGQGIRSLAKGAAEQTLGRAADKQAMIDMVNKGSTLAPYAKGIVDDAATKLSTKIGEKDAALKALLQGSKGEINPDLVANVFPNYAKKLGEKASRVEGKIISPLGEEITTSTPGRAELSGQQLLRLKRGADKAAGYSSSAAPFSEAAASRNAQARQLADVARGQIYQTHGAEDALGSMGKDIRLKQFLTKGANRDPISLLKSKPGTMKDAALATADEAVGSNLRGAGDKIQSAIDLQMNPKNLVHPLGMMPEVRKIATRAAIKTGDALNTGAEVAGSALGAAKVPELAGYAGAREMAGAALPTEHHAAAQPDRNALILQIQDEIRRRQGQ